MDWTDWTDQYLGFKGRSPEELIPPPRGFLAYDGKNGEFPAVASLVFLSVVGTSELIISRMRVKGQRIHGHFLTLEFEGGEIERSAIVTFFELRGFDDTCLIRGTISGPEGWGALRLSVGRPSPRMMGIQVYAGECINITNLRFDLSK